MKTKTTAARIDDQLYAWYSKVTANDSLSSKRIFARVRHTMAWNCSDLDGLLFWKAVMVELA